MHDILATPRESFSKAEAFAVSFTKDELLKGKLKVKLVTSGREEYLFRKRNFQPRLILSFITSSVEKEKNTRAATDLEY